MLVAYCTLLAFGVACCLALVVRGDGAAAPADLEAVLQTLAGWGLASTAHMPWSAPTLVTLGAGLLALTGAAPNLGASERETPRSFFSGFSIFVATALAFWCLLVVLGLSPFGDAVAADRSEQRAASSGLLLIAPFAVMLGIAAGRFIRASIESRVRTNERTIERLAAEIRWLSRSPQPVWAENAPGWRARWLARMIIWAPLAGTIVAVAIGLLVVAAVARPAATAAVIVLTVTSAALMFTLAGFGGVLVLEMRVDPPGGVWRAEHGSLRRRGVVILCLGAVCCAAAVGMPIALLASSAGALDPLSVAVLATAAGGQSAHALFIGLARQATQAASVIALSDRRRSLARAERARTALLREWRGAARARRRL